MGMKWCKEIAVAAGLGCVFVGLGAASLPTATADPGVGPAGLDAERAYLHSMKADGW
jgi:hypothetical protein